MVAAGAALDVEGPHRLREVVEGLVVVEVAGDEPEALGQVPPHVLAERRAGVLLDRVVDDA